MEKLLEDQLKNSKILLDSLSVVKALDDERVPDLLSTVEDHMAKAERLLRKRSELLTRKKAYGDQIEELANEFTLLASRAENVTQSIAPKHSNENPFASGMEGDNRSCQGTSYLDVSPCPSAWANGALDTPKPIERKKNDLRTYCIEQMRNNELNSVPSYMKGRLTSESINAFIGTVNSVLGKKYSIVSLKRREVKQKDLIQYNNWKHQEEEYKMQGQVFFTGEDLTSLGHHKLDKTTDKMIQVLRHTNRLKQTTVTGKVTVYSLINK